MKQHKERPGFMVYYNDWDIVRQLFSAEEFFSFFNAVFDYAQSGVLPGTYPSKQVEIFFNNYKEKIQKDAERYEDVCRKKSEAGKKAHMKKSGDEANASNSRPNTISSSDSMPNQNEYEYEEQYQPQPQQQHQYQPQRQRETEYDSRQMNGEVELPF